MKIRILSLLCALAMLCSLLAACTLPAGNETGDDGNEQGAGPLTDSTKNKLMLATELAGEVDNVKTLSAVINGTSGSSHTKTSADGDVSLSPLSTAKVEELAYSRDENDFGEALGTTSFSWADSIVTKLKTEKNQALQVCKCLNTWVKLAEGPYSSVYRMNYDSTTGTVTVEYHSYPSDFNSYRRFTVTLDAKGKAVIDSYSVSYTDTQIQSSTELHYYEDQYYFSLSMNRSEEGLAHEDTMFLDLSNKVQAYVYVNSTTYYENGVPVRTEYQAPTTQFEYNEGGYTIQAGANGGSLALAPKEGQSNGGQIASINATGMTINLNAFEGWTTVSRDGDYVTLNTISKGAVQSIGFTNNHLGEQNGVTYAYFIPYYEGYETAELWVSFGANDNVSTKDKVRDAFTVLERELGLTMNEALKERLINVGDRHSELAAQFHFKNGIYAKDIVTVEDYFALLDTMRNYEMELDQLKALYDGNGIDQQDQPIENTYFEFLTFSLNGMATLDPNSGILSLDAINASIAPSLLMSEDATYSLVFAWATIGKIYEFASISVPYTGTDMQFVSDVTVNTDNLYRGYGEYRLVAFISMDHLGSHDRISNLYDITSSVTTAITVEEGVVKSELNASAVAITLVNTKIEAEQPQA